MAKTKVALIFGGKSGEHEVSCVSALSVYTALDSKKYEVHLIGIDKNGRWVMPDKEEILAFKSNPRNLNLEKYSETVSLLPYPGKENLIFTKETTREPLAFDVIVPILHGTYGEDGTIQGLFELANLPYVGSGVLGSAICMDKEMAKLVLDRSGIPVVPFLTARIHEYKNNPDFIIDQSIQKFGFPFFIKPANLGSSVGVHKVKSREDAVKFFKDAFQYDTKILIEQSIPARELEVAILGNQNPKASIVGEIIPLHEFYSYEAKYIDDKGADLKIPATDLSQDMIKKIQTIAIRAFTILECSGLARVDFFLDKTNQKLYLNELNTIPGFTSISMYPKLWAASGIPYSALLDELIKHAIEKHRERNALKTSYTPVA